MAKIRQPSRELETVTGVVERVTFHNPQNGWSVLKVSPFQDPHKLATVVVHQAQVYAGASMEFRGAWVNHPQYGEQFKAVEIIEKKPASTGAMEKYLGSGLIKGVGPKTAHKIVGHFREQTLEVFEDRIDELLEVPGIAEKKLRDIRESWERHRAIRDVMLFLQGYGISTLFAVKIYKTYGDHSIQTVSANPYILARDIYGIGFFSADRIALAMGVEPNSPARVGAGIRHVLQSSRDEGHCYLTEEQILKNTSELLEVQAADLIQARLAELLAANEIKRRLLPLTAEEPTPCYYSKTLYFDEALVAQQVTTLLAEPIAVDASRVTAWINRYCAQNGFDLSPQQRASLEGIVQSRIAILTGGPGCGKTTSTKVLFRLLRAMGKSVLLAAPTGRAAQRMSEVIGAEAKTIHRLLEWSPTESGFKKNEQDPLQTDFLIVDECSMLDISLAAALLKAVPTSCQVLLIGDPDQLPAVGAGNVLRDLLSADQVPHFRLTEVFRQAKQSAIIQYAHQINSGIMPKIESPLAHPELWSGPLDCLFIDAEEATQEQVQFLKKAKRVIASTLETGTAHRLQTGEQVWGQLTRTEDKISVDELYEPGADDSPIDTPVFVIPSKFKHANLEGVAESSSAIEELQHVLQRVHPWSSLHYGMTALDTVVRLYTRTISQYYGQTSEIQILTPQIRGTLGSQSLNQTIQTAVNPASERTREIRVGEKIFREGDRVIQTRNNYDLGVFNGDIGTVQSIDLQADCCSIGFGSPHETVHYAREDLTELSLAYAVTVHKSQGSEFEVVIIPVATQHFRMLFRNLIYTALTRARKLAVLVGSRQALALAVRTIRSEHRQTALAHLVEVASRDGVGVAVSSRR